VRADRLVAILMLLQTRGKVTAREVATELEISERTARRDLDALGAAGVPVYSLQGRDGGWRLAGGGKTDLSGLTAAEAQALFLLAGPRATTPELRAALRKLVRAMPEPFRDRVEAASTAVVHDPSGWGGRTTDDRHRPVWLDVIENAVIDARQVLIGYRDRAGNRTERRVHPLGLATKGASWYLVGDTEAGRRTFRVDRVTEVVVTDDPVERPDGFVLADAWQMVIDRVEEARQPERARVLVPPAYMPWMRWVFGSRLRVGAAVPDDRVEVEVRGAHVHAIARDLSGFGSMVEVVDPTALRVRLRELGDELSALYADAAVAPSP
jgi:predicted DNA-binding transcriptional regulator YafY